MENERDNKPVPAQWLHMLNSSHIQRKLEQGPKLKAIFESGRKPEEIVEELYLTILSRFPTAEEVKIAEEYGKRHAAGRASRRKSGKRGKAGERLTTTRGLGRHRLGADQQHRVSVSALMVAEFAGASDRTHESVRTIVKGD